MKKILILENSDRISDKIESYFQTCEIITGNARESGKLFGLHPDLALIGSECLTALEQAEDTACIVIGEPDEQSIRAAVGHGARYFFSESVPADFLAERIEALLAAQKCVAGK